MAKMVRTAQGHMIDWDLLAIQTQANNNVAEPVDVVDQSAIAARRLQRARLATAKQMLDAAQQFQATAATTTSTDVVGDSDQPQQTKKGKFNARAD